MQRLRITFGKGEEIKYISHLDLMRAWERALRRARIPLAYSQGFNPRPRLFFASALPVGFTSRAEMLDVVLQQRMGLREFASRVREQLPAGLELKSLAKVPVTLPALSAQVVAAEYEVAVESQDAPHEMQARLEGLLAMSSIPRRRERPDGTREYDLRPLIQKLWIIGRRDGVYILGMRLQADGEGTGRPDEVLAALGLAQAVRAIERTELFLKPA
ncbi:MAG: TIGR03936 family radical SAM-associated protein [Anaerolineae bacterium]